MRSAALALLALPFMSCALLGIGGGGGATASGPKASPAGPKPSWVDKTTFHETQGEKVILYGVGTAEVDQPKPGACWNDILMLEKAEGRARAELTKLLKVEVAQGENATETSARGTLERSSVQSGWFDGEKLVYVLAKITRDKDAVGIELDPKASHSPAGGLPPLQLKDAVRAASRAAVACDDPYKRKDLPCCGPLQTYCSDRSRFDQTFPGGVCRCGSADPCLQDFKCLPKSGATKCVCQGPKCPCDILNCKPGQQCADGRCF